MLRQTLLFWRYWFPTTTHISDDMDLLLSYHLLDLVRCTFTTWVIDRRILDLLFMDMFYTYLVYP